MVLALNKDLLPNGMDQGDLYAVLSNLVDTVNALAADSVLSAPGLAIGSNSDDVATAAFTYRIAGIVYSKGAVSAGTGPGNDVIPENTYGAVALDIAADGTLDAIEAPGNATGYVSAEAAVAALPAPAAGHIRVGWVTATSADGNFTFGTTALDAADTTVVFTDAPSAALALGTPLKLTKG